MTNQGTLDQLFADALDRFPPERMAFAAEEVPVTFGELATSVDRLAAGLRADGVNAGDIVGYSLPNCPEAISIIPAISRVGASAVPLFPMIPAQVRAGIFASLGCRLVLSTGPGTAALAEAGSQMHACFRVVDLTSLSGAGDGGSPPAMGPDHRLLAAASSGTTGAPKSVWMSQTNVVASLTAAADMGRVGSWRDNSDFCTMAAFPLCTSGILVILGMLFNGTRLVFARDLSPVRYLQLAAHHRAEALSAPPAYFEAILALPSHLTPPLEGVSAVLTGMDFFAPSLLARLSRRFPCLDRAVSGYGLVETSTVFMNWKAHRRDELASPTHIFSLCPGSGNQIDVRNEQGQGVPEGEKGELWVRGSSVVSGYLGRPSGDESPFVDGWFRTGDVARRGKGQDIELCGRQKYLIKRGGKSVAPNEVQDRLEACPGVLASAVVGVNQPLYGQMIWAFVVADRARPASLKDVMVECRASLPNYMVPDHVTFIPELPRGSGAGKIDREALIRMAENQLKSLQGERHA